MKKMYTPNTLTLKTQGRLNNGNTGINLKTSLPLFFASNDLSVQCLTPKDYDEDGVNTSMQNKKKLSFINVKIQTLNLMNIKLPFLKKTVLLALCLLAFNSIQAQQDLSMRFYGEFAFADYTVLDDVFGTVTSNGAVKTVDDNQGLGYSTLPTTVAGFGGVQFVFVRIAFRNDGISIAQADALVAYVKGGGVLALNAEKSNIIGTSENVGVYIGNRLLCNNVSLGIITPASGPGFATSFHPGNGNMLVNATYFTTTSYDAFNNVPSENAVYSGQFAAATAPCNASRVLDMIIPAYPTAASTNNTCGVNGFAIISGEAAGTFNTTPSNGNFDNRPVTIKYAELIRDYLYDAPAMAARVAWSQNASNTSTTCPPALPCAAGTVAPVLTAATKSNTCPATTVDLTTITATNQPANTTLTWHTATPATDANKVPGTMVAAGTYYAAFFDSANSCYSGTNGDATTLVTATVTDCCDAGTDAPRFGN